MDKVWHSVIDEDDFPEEGKFAAEVAGWHVLIARLDDGFHAVIDCCTHQATPLSGGRIRRGVVMCPLHGTRFELGTGRCIGGAYRDLRVFPLRVVDGKIEVSVPESAPGPSERPIIR